MFGGTLDTLIHVARKPEGLGSTDCEEFSLDEKRVPYHG
jgi:hypothetical protein